MKRQHLWPLYRQYLRLQVSVQHTCSYRTSTPFYTFDEVRVDNLMEVYLFCWRGKWAACVGAILHTSDCSDVGRDSHNMCPITGWGEARVWGKTSGWSSHLRHFTRLHYKWYLHSFSALLLSKPPSCPDKVRQPGKWRAVIGVQVRIETEKGYDSKKTEGASKMTNVEKRDNKKRTSLYNYVANQHHILHVKVAWSPPPHGHGHSNLPFPMNPHPSKVFNTPTTSRQSLLSPLPPIQPTVLLPSITEHQNTNISGVF